MPTYISTQQLSDAAGVSVPTIRQLEERGILKAAPGREKYRKRWAKTAAYDLRRALRLYVTNTNPAPFNAVLPPGALAAAATPQLQEKPVTTNSLEEAMDCFQKRTAAITLSEKSAKAIAEAWIEVRSGSKNEASALTKVMERVNKGKDRKQSAASIRAYLIHLGLVERLSTGNRYHTKPTPTRTRRVYKNGHDTTAPRVVMPDIAGMDVNDIEAVLPLLRQMTELSAPQRSFIIAWLQKR